MVNTKKYYLGIDLGGTAIKGGIILVDGTILASDSIPTEKELGNDRIIDNICTLAERLIAAANITKCELVGVGIGIPGMVNPDKGLVRYANNLGFRDFKIKAAIEERFDLPVMIANDANAAALGEVKFGVAAHSDVASVLVTLGTGVGGGIIIGNKIYAGNRGAGAEIGHMVIRFGGEKCTCGRRGCFEAYSSATALIRDTKRAMIKDKTSKMWEVGTIEEVDGRTAFDYADKDTTAAKVVKNYLKMLACGLANVANVFRPEIIILGGGVSSQGESLLKPLQRLVNKELYGGKLGPIVKILIAQLGNRAGFLGAAALLM